MIKHNQTKKKGVGMKGIVVGGLVFALSYLGVMVIFALFR